MNVHRDEPPPPPRQSNPWIGLLMLGMICATAVIITLLVTS